MKRRRFYKSKREILDCDFDLVQIEKDFNPRLEYGDIDSLGDSIWENGLLKPIEVFSENSVFIVDDGHRRHRACARNISKYGSISEKHTTVPIVVNPKKDLSDRLAATVIYNDGKPFSAAEEAFVFSKLRDSGKTAAQVASMCGKSVIHVLDRLILVDSDPEIMKAVLSGSLKSSIAVKAAKAIKTLDENRSARILSDVKSGDSEAIKKASRINLNGSFRIRKQHKEMLLRWLKLFNKYSIESPEYFETRGRIEGLKAVLDIDADAWELLGINYTFDLEKKVSDGSN